MDDIKFQQRNVVVKGLRRALAQTKHLVSFSKRIKTVIEKELPGYTISLEKAINSMGLDSINVWGNGIEYNERVHLSWNTGRPWAEALEREIEIADYTDYQERARDEETVIPALEYLEAVISRAQAEAEQLIKDLPIPKTATVRAEASMWDSPSSDLRKRFPKLFP